MTWSDERRTFQPGRASCVTSTISVETAIERTWSRPSLSGGSRRGSSVTANSISTGPPAAFSAERKERLHDVVQRVLIVDEERREVQDAGPGHAGARHETIRGGVPGGRREAQRAVLFGVHERASHEVLGLAHRVVGRRLSHVHGPELGLRALEEVGGRGERRRRARMGGRVGPGHPSVHDRLPEAERQEHDPVLGAGRAEAVEAVRARHAGDVRVVALAVPEPHDLLQEDRHLLLPGPGVHRGPVGLRAPEIRRGPDQLHRLGQLPEAGVRLRAGCSGSSWSRTRRRTGARGRPPGGSRSGPREAREFHRRARGDHPRDPPGGRPSGRRGRWRRRSRPKGPPPRAGSPP